MLSSGQKTKTRKIKGKRLAVSIVKKKRKKKKAETKYRQAFKKFLVKGELTNSNMV